MAAETDMHPADSLEQYCRMLGHGVSFSYCRHLPEGRPCRLIVECWQGQFDITTFLEERYSGEQIESFLASPKPKLTSIIELIEKARQNREVQG
jgi:hypothetical protein